MNINKRVKELEAEAIELRRWLHQHAELSWQEYETTEFIVSYLEKLGLEVYRFDGHTGCWAMIHGGKATTESKTIMLRADIDALPILEETNLPYASVREGVFHACGHENHVAMLLIACKILVEIQADLPGHVKILFQAAEETACGADYYVQQGVLDGVDAVYGCHIFSNIEPGRIVVDPGPRHAATDEFTIRFQGLGCHGGMPQYGKDAIVAACATVMNLQTIVSRMTDPLDSLVITVGKFNAGANYNIVADTAELNGTVRSYLPAVRNGAQEKMRKVADATAAAFGCTAELEYIKKTGPVVHDNPMMNQLAHDAVIKLFGKEALITDRPICGGDDFAYFSERVPGIYASIGGACPAFDGNIYNHHHPKVCFSDDALKYGIGMFVQMTVDFLNTAQ